MRYLLPLALTCLVFNPTAAQEAATDTYDTLFLTWFGDPTTTIAAQWLTTGQPDQTAPVEAAIVPADRPDAEPIVARSSAAAFGRGDLLRQRVAFTGLMPDTRYHLRLPGLDTPLLLATAPARIDKPLVFAEGGDCGTYEQTWMLHRLAAAWDPLFAVIGGDLAYADGKHTDRWVTFLRGWREHMVTKDGRLIPMIAAIGNHEARGGFGRSRDDAPLFHALFDGLFPETGYAALDVNADLSFLLLDSNHTTRVEGAQTDWLARALDQRKDKRFVIPIYHVPMYPAYRSETGGARGDARMKQREHWLPLFDQHELPVAFEHDDHVYKRTHPLRAGKPAEGGTIYLGDGAWGKLRGGAVSPDDHEYLLKATTRRHVMRITLHPADSGKLFDMLAVDEHGERIDRYPQAE